MEVDVDVVIWIAIKIKGLEPSNINMGVDVDVTTWSTTKTKGPKPWSINVDKKQKVNSIQKNN